MQEMIDEREKAEAKDERWDLFSSLIDASRDESDAQYKLSDSELMGEFSSLARFPRQDDSA
jgi:hypothetical protein